ncbi:MAG TPA: hypothetical protein VIG46_11005 [Candidatus Baltobacteraceae bacterium]|jgi:hypothetical protein
MKNVLIACALAVITAVGCASAQPQSGDGRAAMQQARADAKAASWSALSADHQTKVQTVVNGFNAGTLDIPTASQQIDAILTPAETTAVLAQSQKLRDAMKAAFAANGGGQGGAGRGGMGAGRTQDAGRFLLSLDADRDKWRAAMQALRGAGGPP